MHIFIMYFLKINFFIMHFYKKLNQTHPYLPLTFLLLYNKNIIVNLYKLHFSSFHFFYNQTKSFLLSHFSTFSTKHMTENQIFSIIPLIFHSPIFLLFHSNGALIILPMYLLQCPHLHILRVRLE